MNSSPQNPMLRCRSLDRPALPRARSGGGCHPILRWVVGKRPIYTFPACSRTRNDRRQAVLVSPSREVTADPEQMPSPIEVERLLAAASSRLGRSEAATLAQASARMYSWARAIPGAVTAGRTRRRGARRIRLRLLVGLDLDDRRLVGAAARPTRPARPPRWTIRSRSCCSSSRPTHRRHRARRAAAVRPGRAGRRDRSPGCRPAPTPNCMRCAHALGWRALIPDDDPVVHRRGTVIVSGAGRPAVRARRSPTLSVSCATWSITTRSRSRVVVGRMPGRDERRGRACPARRRRQQRRPAR